MSKELIAEIYVDMDTIEWLDCPDYEKDVILDGIVKIDNLITKCRGIKSQAYPEVCQLLTAWLRDVTILTDTYTWQDVYDWIEGLIDVPDETIRFVTKTIIMKRENKDAPLEDKELENCLEELYEQFERLG